MDTSMLFGALICTCSVAAQKWSRLSVHLKRLVAGFSKRSDWALTLGRLALIGALSKYPMLAPRITGDLDFGRRLQRFSNQDLQGLPLGTKKNIRLCIKNLEIFEKKRKQEEQAEFRKHKQKERRREKQEAARRVAKRAAMALEMVAESIQRRTLD
ncbi:unnamed protein product [Symbiodinium sp. CCMP2592]|nr:unnamed protein product [Symbiodinium sp. CCMP2592]